MVEIHKNKVRNIEVRLTRECAIQAETTTAPKSGNVNKTKRARIITFGVVSENSTMVPCHYNLSEGGTRLNIFTGFDDFNQPFPEAPSVFSIWLPAGCKLQFTYTN